VSDSTKSLICFALDDPTLIDPNTGLPYGGRMTLPLSTWSESRSIAAGEREQKSMFLTRHCIGGLVSKRSLVGSGLTQTQAKQFFKKPMTFTFGSSGTVQVVDFLSCKKNGPGGCCRPALFFSSAVPSAHAAAAEQIHDRQQDDGADQRDQERGQRDALIDRADAEQRGHDESGEQRADDTDNDVEQDALLRVGAHDDAGEPAHHAAHDQPDENTHTPSSGSPKRVTTTECERVLLGSAFFATR
jgi:hypothetical protein